MATSVNYGMGQYRFDKNYNYLSSNYYKVGASDDGKTWISDNSDRYGYININGHQEAWFSLPYTSDISGNSSDNAATPIVQYGETFYVRLTLPQNPEYTTTVNLKLCAGTNGKRGNESNIETERFQHLKRIVIPPTPRTDDNIYNPVILFDTDGINDTSLLKDNDAAVQLWPEGEFSRDRTTYQKGYIYERQNNNHSEYRYFTQSGNWSAGTLVKNVSFTTLTQKWKVVQNQKATITYDFVFSPKYNLTQGYSFLLMEIDRSDSHHSTIQYIGEDTNTYNGTRFELSDIELELYHVGNLLQGVSPQIQAGGTNNLSHIGIWGHPEQIFVINGEEIRIGQSGFYELNDFNITSLGAVVDPNNPTKDRFTIDYEYRIVK